jgi:hypothetical protein
MKEEHKNSAPTFFTCVHKFAQSFSAISVDAEIRCAYRALQIEPGSLRTSTDQFKRRSMLQSKVRRELNREARGFTEQHGKARHAERRVALPS